MTRADPIRAALKRLIEALEDYEPIWGGFPESALAAARAALATDGPAVPESREPASVVGDPSDDELGLIYHDCCGGCEFMDQGGFEDAARAVLARWGHQPAPHDNRGVLPMIISDTGASEEPERERIICASISGGADYINNMPRMLILERIELNKGSIRRRYIQEPTPPAEGEVAEQRGEPGARWPEHWFRPGLQPGEEEAEIKRLRAQQTPVPQGEVAELVAWLGVVSEQFRFAELGDEADQTDRAATLLAQLQVTPVPVSEGLPGAADIHFEFVVSDADYCTQAGGIAPTYAQAVSEGQRYLAQYQQDGPHTLELRRIEVLPLPAIQGGEVEA